MLVSVNSDVVSFCNLVEHPGGHDGGEFPQYHNYGIDGDVAFYETDLPVCSNDTFCDEDIENYQEVGTHHKALNLLKERLNTLQKSTKMLGELVARFEKASSFEIRVPEDEDEDEDE